MRELDVSSASTTNGFPPKSGTWVFLQDAYREIAESLAINKIGNSYSAAAGYIMYGCESSVAGGNTSFTAGAIFYNGRIYISPAQTIATPGGGNVIVTNILSTPYTTNADPVQFSGGGAPINVHAIKTAQFAAGTAGSGTMGGIDYSNLLRLDNQFVSTGIVFNTIGINTWANFGAPYYDVAYRITGNVVNLCGVISCTVAPGTIPSITLPVAARPTKEIKLEVVISLGGSDYATNLYIRTNGNIEFDSNASSTAILYLDNISFRLR